MFPEWGPSAVLGTKPVLFVPDMRSKCCSGHEVGSVCSRNGVKWPRDSRFSGKACVVTLIFSNFVNSDELERYLYMKVKIVNKSAYETPFYATEKSAGMDLKANIAEPVTLGPLERAMVPTGLYIALPDGTEAQVRPRSGLAAKHGISVLNAPGTIDADYRGEVKVILVNLSNEPFVINPGERIAQMVVARYEKVEWDEVEVLDETERGEGGFGSTGK